MSLLIVTGANGFLGKHTINQASQTSWSTIGIVRRKEAFHEVISKGGKPVLLETFTVSELTEIFTNAQAVINFLGIVSGTQEQFQRINVDNFEKMIRASEEAKVKRIICISGLGVDQYGKKDWATNNYFKSKLAMEKLLRESSVPYVIFRPSYILGPGDELIPELITNLKKGNVQVIGPGTDPMQPIYVKDATKAFLQAANGIGPDNKTYDLVGPQIITMNEFLSMVRIILQEYVKLPKTKIKHVSIKEAEELLGYPKEISDIFLSDSVGDPKIVEHALQIGLTALSETLIQTISTELSLKP